MKIRPLSPETLIAELVDRIDGHREAGWTRVVVDGAEPTRPGDLTGALVDPLRALGRPVLRVSAADFLRPASVRLEHGRTDPDAFRDDWLDTPALLREVLNPLAPGGTGKVLPSLWNPVTDRASRAEYTYLPEGGVLLLDGTLLLGRGLPVELSVHLRLSPAALVRQTAPDRAWTLPAYDGYDPNADVLVRYDHSDRPALVV